MSTVLSKKEEEREARSRDPGGAMQKFFSGTGGVTRFFFRFFKEAVRPPYEFREFLRQSYISGYRSIQLVAITGFIMGLVLTIQARPTLVEFGAESWLPAMVAVSVIREIGPVITALICAGKIGSGIGAELASMRITEQIDAMEVAGNNPFKFVVVTRVLAVSVMIPALVVLGDAVALFGSWVAVNIKGAVSFRLFFAQVFEELRFVDLIPSLIKTFFFGMAVGLIACYKGYNSNRGTEGVGEASNQSVVIASLVIFFIDMVAVQVTSFFL